MKRNYWMFINDILENIELIEKSTSKISKTEFEENKDIIDATLRRLEIIGEASKNLPSSLTKKYSEIPWKDIAGFRDIMIHAYFIVDIDKVWEVVRKDIPDLKKKISEIKKEKIE
ncbi:MAG: DUF86 domain-containing protein [Nanoarchaeota archaeon]